MTHVNKQKWKSEQIRIQKKFLIAFINEITKNRS